MCGRYATSRSSADLSAAFDAADEVGDLAPDYNVAPTDRVPIVRLSARVGGRVLSAARWGLVPPWAPDLSGAARMINARVETVATSRAYAPSFASRRCLVPADGWYEWVRSAGRRQPYFMTRRDGEPLAFAGLWSVWGSGADRVLTCTVLTRPAVGDLALVHERMPLVLPPVLRRTWLDAAPGDPGVLLRVPDEEYVAGLELRPVGSAVGDVRNDGPDLVRRTSAPPLTAQPSETVDLTLF